MFAYRPKGLDDPWLANANGNGVPQNENAALMATLGWLIQSDVPNGVVIAIMPDAKYAIHNVETTSRTSNNIMQVRTMLTLVDIV